MRDADPDGEATNREIAPRLGLGRGCEVFGKLIADQRCPPAMQQSRILAGQQAFDISLVGNITRIDAIVAGSRLNPL